MNSIIDVIRQLETQKAAIEKALEALREVGGESSGGSSAPVTKRRGRPAKVADLTAAAPAQATRKGGMTPEGRKRLAEAMKRRWAVKRTAPQAKKKAGRPKKAA
jgi:hypothetical protein